MKIRNCFVSNSSSSSFIVSNKRSEDEIRKILNVYNDPTFDDNVHIHKVSMTTMSEKDILNICEEIDNLTWYGTTIDDIGEWRLDIYEDGKVLNDFYIVATSENYYNDDDLEKISDEFNTIIHHLG